MQFTRGYIYIYYILNIHVYVYVYAYILVRHVVAAWSSPELLYIYIYVYIYIHLIIYEHSMCLYMKESYESYEAKSRLRFLFATLEVRRGSGALPPKLADRSPKNRGSHYFDGL